AKRAAEQHTLEEALRTARAEVDRRSRELQRIQKAFDDATAAVEKSQAIVDDLEARLAALVEDEEEDEETDASA
ncbi:MAG: hypothetical protein H0X17_04705, partial [Deltaproteobacteria bacterium]|nr:hypothetical protein [Deltaproteobacteria bacterium]